MNRLFNMKLLSVVTLTVCGFWVASFCCPEPARSGEREEAADQKVHCEAGAGVETGEPPDTSNPLPVISRAQEGYYSCWSTCAEMVMEFLEAGRIRQCEQANAAFNHFTCCVGGGVLNHGDRKSVV